MTTDHIFAASLPAPGLARLVLYSESNALLADGGLATVLFTAGPVFLHLGA